MMMMMFLHGWPESCPSGVILKHSINKSLRNLQLMQKKNVDAYLSCYKFAFSFNKSAREIFHFT